MEVTGDRCKLDDHTDGHYITLFTEQLTRTFEVLVLNMIAISKIVVVSM